jgi:hypothetical protein
MPWADADPVMFWAIAGPLFGLTFVGVMALVEWWDGRADGP